MGFTQKYKRGLFPRYGNKPLKASQVLETQLQTKLQIASIQSTGGLSEFPVGNLVVSAAARSRQDEVGPIEYVESLPLKLQVYTFGEFEDLGQGHVGVPGSRSHKGVSAEITGAPQTRRGEH